MIPGTQEPKNPRTQELRIKNSKLSTILLCSVFCVLLSLAACNQPTAPDAETSGSSDMIRRAQMVGQENIQLKKQITDLEKQVADLQKQLADAHGEAQTVTEQHGEATRLLMMRLLECTTKLEALQNN